jgi:hypothetical protein
MPVPTVTLSGPALAGVAPALTPAHLRALPAQTVRLGRIEPKARRPVLRLANYLRAGYTLPPLPVDYAAKAMSSLSRMYLNDTYGDCVVASAYHQVGLWTGNESGTPVVGSDQEVLSMYHTICGPGDNGCVITDVLDYARDHGLPFNGQAHRIDGYVAVDWTNWDEVLVALFLVGSIKLGINLPEEWTSAAVWDVTDSPIVGGHDVPCVKADADGITIASWARLYKITRAAFMSRKWLSEAYAVLSPDWYARAQRAPNLIDAATLRADLAKLGSGQIPDIDHDPPPPPPPPPPPAPVRYFGIKFRQRVPKNGIVGPIPAFHASVEIPPGDYDVVGHRAAEAEGEQHDCEAIP